MAGAGDHAAVGRPSRAAPTAGHRLTTSRAVRGTSLESFPNVKGYLARIGARQAYQRAMAKAEPGMKPWLS